VTNSGSDITRRAFLKVASSAGVVAMLGATVQGTDANSPKKAEVEKIPEMPTRRLGRTGVMVPILNQGAMFDVITNQLVMHKSLEWGVTMWDTSAGYTKGKSEIGLGMFFESNPQARKNIFLVTKTDGANSTAEMTAKLNTSLERMKIDQVDLVMAHGLSTEAELTGELKAWAENVKKSGKAKFFGFSTHKNMAECMQLAAKTGWLDVIMPSINFRTLQDDATKRAIEACRKADVGLIAMKIMAASTKATHDMGAPVAEDKVLGQLMQRGFSLEQAKLKYVWQEEAVASACVRMPTVAILGANYAAALDKTQLSAADMAAMDEYAAATCGGYCRACLGCEDGSYERSIPDVMRCLMYNNSYGDAEFARERFAQIPASFRSRMATTDFSPAEARCPHRLPIERLMHEAVETFA
jgi:predicted aldo/keto reductase-like oxidoreductase